MVCEISSSLNTISDVLVWPTGCNYYFWLIILGVIFVVMAWGMYKNEEKRKGEGEFISAIGVSSIATTFLAVLGTLVKNASDIPMIQGDILLTIVAVTVVIILVWIFKD